MTPQQKRECRKKNLEKIRAVARASYQRHKEKRLAAAKAYRKNNAGHLHALEKAARERRKLDPERMNKLRQRKRIRERLWRLANPEKARQRYLKSELQRDPVKMAAYEAMRRIRDKRKIIARIASWRSRKGKEWRAKFYPGIEERDELRALKAKEKDKKRLDKQHERLKRKLRKQIADNRRNFRLSNPHQQLWMTRTIVRLLKKESKQRQRKILHHDYMKNLLTRDGGLSYSDIPPSLLAVKQKVVAIHRLIKENQQ